MARDKVLHTRRARAPIARQDGSPLGTAAGGASRPVGAADQLLGYSATDPSGEAWVDPVFVRAAGVITPNTVGDELQFPCGIEGKGPFAFGNWVVTFNGTPDPGGVFGYNRGANGLIVAGEPAIGWVVEGDYDDASGQHKAEAYGEYVMGDGMTARRWVSVMFNRVTGLPVAASLCGGASGVSLTINDGTGTAEEKITGRKVLLANLAVTDMLSTSFRLRSTNPMLVFYDTNGDVDKKFFRVHSQNGTLKLQSVNDAYNAAVDLWTVDYLAGAMQVPGALTLAGGLVSYGANDSGGAGYRQVLVPNA